MDLAAAHDVVIGPFLMTDQANGPPHFTALSVVAGRLADPDLEIFEIFLPL